MFFFPLFVRHGECTQTDVYVCGTEVCVWSEVSVWLAGWADLPAAGQHLDGLDARPLWNSERQHARWLPVRTSKLKISEFLESVTSQYSSVSFYICCLHFSSPAGMIEGTPQLHVNAWKVSSACVSPVNIPIIDPCEMNQQNGTCAVQIFITNTAVLAVS